MFHLELFSSSIASGATTFAQLTYFTPDNIMPKLNQGAQVLVALPKVMAVMGVGAHMASVRVQAPSFLPLPYPTLGPNNRGTAFESPPRIWDFSSNPFALRPTEELDIFATQNAGAAETEYVAVIMTDGVRVAPPAIRTGPTLNGDGGYFTAHWTASTTLTAGQWSLVAPIFDQPLPAGLYSLIGVRCFSATALFFRMFPAVAPLWRPGGVAVQAYDQLDPVNQRGFQAMNFPGQGWGEWLRFYQNVPPQVEFFSTAADTSEEGFFDLIKVSDATTTGAM
jgi:hypothetical protein